MSDERSEQPPPGVLSKEELVQIYNHALGKPYEQMFYDLFSFCSVVELPVPPKEASAAGQSPSKKKKKAPAKGKQAKRPGKQPF